MNHAVADQMKLFGEQAEAWKVSNGEAKPCFDLEDQLAFGVFLFDRLREVDERFRLNVAGQTPELDAEILWMYRQWGKAANSCLSALAQLETEGVSVRYAPEFRQRCQEARGILASEIACPLPPRENRKKNELADLLSQVTDENIHAEVDFGPPVGKEVW